jgi:hypothetical protein
MSGGEERMDGEDVIEQVRTWTQDVADRPPYTEREFGNPVATVTAADNVLNVRTDPDAQWLLVEHVFDVPASDVELTPPSGEDAPAMSFEEAIERLIEARPALVDGGATRQGDAFRIRVSSTVSTDGLTRQVFAGACDETLRTKRAVERLVVDLGRQREVLANLHESLSASIESLEGEMPGPDASLEAIDVSSPSGWAPTHMIPAPGMASWATPDPSVPPTDSLQPGLELQVAEHFGDWARVVASNGWSGWVDARLLVPMVHGRDG